MREFLKGLGLDQETIDSIMAEHGKLISQSTERINALTTENTTLKNENDELKKYDGKALQESVDTLTKEKNELIENHKKDLADKAFESALKLSIAKSGTIDPTALMAHVDRSKLSLDDKEELVGWNEQLESIKGSCSYLFNAKDYGGDHGGINRNQNDDTSLSGALTEHYK